MKPLYLRGLDLVVITMSSYFLANLLINITKNIMLDYIDYSTSLKNLSLISTSSKPSSKPAPLFKLRNSTTICNNNIFNYMERPCNATQTSFEKYGVEEYSFDEIGSVPPACEGNYKLYATTILPEKSIAIIKVEDKPPQYFIEGQEVKTNVKVELIGWRFVVLKENEGECVLDLYGFYKAKAGQKRMKAEEKNIVGRTTEKLIKAIEEGVEVISETERNVERGLINRLLEQQNQLLRLVRVVPYLEGNKVTGFQVTARGNEETLRKIGLQSGDIIKSINGLDITNPTQALAVYGALRTTSKLTVTVVRGGKVSTLKFNIR